MDIINQQTQVYPIPPRFKSEEAYLSTLTKNQRKKYYRYKRVAENLLQMQEANINDNPNTSSPALVIEEDLNPVEDNETDTINVDRFINNSGNDFFTRKNLIPINKGYKNGNRIQLNDVNGGVSLATEFAIQYYAKVLRIVKCIEDTGKISIKIITDMDKYFKSISNEAGVPEIEHIYNTDFMCEGDIYKVILQESRGCDKLYWVWSPYHKNEQNTPTNIDISYESVCPVCKQKLTDIDGDRYCVNDQCPSRLRMSIRRYLQVATKELWSIEDIVTFDKLVTLGRLKTVADIYTLTAKEINSLEPYFAYSELDLGESIINKINNTRGTVTIFNFISSLCLPKVNGFILNKREIDKIDSIETFIVILSNNNRSEYTRYMSSKAAYVLRQYFEKDSTMSYVTKLIEEQIFDS